MITNYLPKFKVLEANNLTGLRSGHMLSQFPANKAIATKAIGEYKFIENGIFVGLDADGTINNFNKANHDRIFVHFTEEILTVLPGLEHFAVQVEEEEDTYIRCVALYCGDTVTTDNFTGTEAGAKYAKIVNGVASLQSAADADTCFIAKKDTMPNGSVGYELTFYKMPKATI